MGNGVSKTYPAGILKTPPKTVRFGKPEVRTFRQDSWETTPLLNTHEVARIEAKIRATPTQPMKPQKVRYVPPQKTPHNHTWAVLAGVAIVTGVVCAFAGPFGLIIPAVALVTWAIHKAATRPQKSTPEMNAAKLNTYHHLCKLAAKHERAGLTEQAALYKHLAANLARSING